MLPTFNIPPIGPKQGKLWGQTQLVFAYNGVEAHSLVIQKGGFCSRHYHLQKWNRFLVTSGKLLVRQFFDGKSDCDSTIIVEGQLCDVPPGIQHEFEALEETRAIELYWTVLDAGDIERVNQGGIRS